MIVVKQNAASKPPALHKPGMGVFVICLCDAGAFGMGMFGIGVLWC
ncbi:MAG TPA: hypothetical protein VGR81_09325 [Candidatus Acidoferrales bacterium]|nr:hypothetical protein [Candidatus Acidoferrales bacterium]